MRLYIEGHNHKRGYVINRSWSHAECSALAPPTKHETDPVRYIQERERAFRFVERYNRLFATH